MKCCECQVELFSFATLLQHLASHARRNPPPPSPPKPKRSILEDLLARKTAELEGSSPKLPKIELEKLFINSDEIEIRLKTTRPVSDDSVSSSSSPKPADADLKAWKFQDIVEKRIKYYCMTTTVDEGCQTPVEPDERTAGVECDSTDAQDVKKAETKLKSDSELVFENSEMEITKKKLVGSVGDIKITRRPAVQAEMDFDPLSICAVTMNEEDDEEMTSGDGDSGLYLESTDDSESIGSDEAKTSAVICPESACSSKFTTSSLVTKNSKTAQDSPALPNQRRKEFPCTLCPKIFGWCTDLKRHMLTHTGERPFKCSFCGVDYNRKFLLENHLVKKHAQASSSASKRKSFSPVKIPRKQPKLEESPEQDSFTFKCDKCDEKFKFRAQYLCHILSH